MKKFTLTLIALVCAIAANAADWYLVGGAFASGDDNGWNDVPERKFRATDNADVFTLGPITLSGDIKIKEAGKWDTAFGSNGSKLKADSEYKANKNGGNIAVDGIIENAVITINAKDYTILVKGEEKENEYDTVYLIGNFGNGWSEDVPSAYPLHLQEGSATLWTGTFTLTAATSYFKMRAGANIYGTGADDVAVKMGEKYRASQSGNAFTLTPGEYTFTFDLAKNADSGELTVTGAVAPPVYPSALYVLGNVNDLNWNPTTGVAMTSSGEGIYTVTDLRVTGQDGNDKGYFSFCEKLMESYTEGAWEIGQRYGATSPDYAASLTEPNEIAPGDKAFCLPNGKYTLTVNLKDMTLTVTGTADPVKFPEALYVLGNVNGFSWNPTQGVVMMSTEEGVYKAEGITVADAEEGNGFFSFCTQLMESYTEGAWEVGQRYGAAELNTPASLTEPNTILKGENSFSIAAGRYDFTVSLKDMTLTVATNTEPPFIPETAYIIGNINGNQFSPTLGTPLEKKFDGVFSLSGVNVTAADGSDYGYFSFCEKLMESYSEGAWELGHRYGPVSADFIPVLDEANTIANSEFAFKVLPGEYTIGIDFNTMSMTISCTRVVYPEAIFMLGNINAQGWNPTNGVRLPAESEGVYSITNQEIMAASEDSEFGYFSFATRLMPEYTEGAWEVGIRYGAEEADKLVIEEEAMKLIPGDNAFMVAAPARYDVIVNLKEMTVTLKPHTQSVSTLDTDEGDAVYFNLQGIRVAEPTGGLYIRVKGDKAEKVIVRK